MFYGYDMKYYFIICGDFWESEFFNNNNMFFRGTHLKEYIYMLCHNILFDNYIK